MEYTEREMKVVLLASCLGVFLSPLASTMMNLALVAIGIDFSVGSHQLAMVNTVFLLTSVMAMVPMTRAADVWGLKKVFFVGLILMGLPSLAAFFTQSFPFLLGMRGLMGVGAACIAVTGIALVTNIFPANRRGWAIGINATAVYVGLAIGPTLGGLVTDTLGWRALFLFVVPVSAISAIAMLFFKKEIAPGRGESFDMKGSLVYALTILFLMYGVISLPSYWALVLILIGAVLMALFIKFMGTAKHPVMNLEVFRIKMFRRPCLAAFMNYAASYSVSFFFALYLQHIGALSAMEAGAVMLIQPVIQIILTVKAGSMYDRMLNKRILPTAGMAMISVAAGMMIFLSTNYSQLYVVAILVLLGLGYGLFSAPNTAMVMSSVPPNRRSMASGTLALARQTGMMVSMGIAMCCIAVILGSSSVIGPSNHGDFVRVIQMAFGICLAMCVAGTAMSWYVGKPASE